MTQLNRHILLTGGIGDIIALESFMSEDQRKCIKSICYATAKWDAIHKLLLMFPWAQNIQHICVWRDFSKLFAFHFKSEVHAALVWHNLIGGNYYFFPAYIHSEDWSIGSIFPKIHQGLLSYTYSSVVKYKMADLTIDLPSDFVVIAPYSSDKRFMGRDFDGEDWVATQRYLHNYGLTGLVLNEGDETVPLDSHLVNLTNKTTFNQACEILKRAQGYIGIDTSLACVACKLFDHQHLAIKTANQHYINNMAIYCAGHTEFPFVANHIKEIVG